MIVFPRFVEILIIDNLISPFSNQLRKKSANSCDEGDILVFIYNNDFTSISKRVYQLCSVKIYKGC